MVDTRAGLLERRCKKFMLDEAHIQYLRDRGLSNFEIADQLIQSMIEILRAGVKVRRPGASDDEVLQEMKEIVERDREIKHERRFGHG
jgi:hypothetical protein